MNQSPGVDRWAALLERARDPHFASGGRYDRPQLSTLIESARAAQAPDDVADFFLAISDLVTDESRLLVEEGRLELSAWRLAAEVTLRLTRLSARFDASVIDSSQRLSSTCIRACTLLASKAYESGGVRQLVIPNDTIEPIAYLHLTLAALKQHLPLSSYTVTSGFFASSPPLVLDVLISRDHQISFGAHLIAYLALGWIAPEDVSIRIAQWAGYLEQIADRRLSMVVLDWAGAASLVGHASAELSEIRQSEAGDSDAIAGFTRSIYSEDEISDAICASQPVFPDGLRINSFVSKAVDAAAALIGEVLQSTCGSQQATSFPAALKERQKRRAAELIATTTRGLDAEQKRPVALTVGGSESGAGPGWAGKRASRG